MLRFFGSGTNCTQSTGIKAALDNPGTTFKGYVIHEDAPVTEITLYMESLTAEEREIIKAGSLINFNKNRQM